MEELSKADKKTIQTIERKFKKALVDYRLIEENDHILIGLSGGKDSLALVELIGKTIKISKQNFKATAIHVSVENISYQSDLEYLKAHCIHSGIEFIHASTHFDIRENNSKSVCYLCSSQRRKIIFEVAKQLGCNKVALGHHLDDAVETLIMNMVFQGAFSSMPPKIQFDKFDMTIIRPLSLISERELLEMERIRNYNKQLKNCPYEKDSYRKNAKGFIKELEKWHPNVRQNLWASMQNIKSEYLVNKDPGAVK